jgi:DNA-binding LacI/PurR family transcriptional regulator
LDRQIFVPNSDSVLLDQVSGAYDITTFLIEQGHKHIAHIAGPIDYYTAQERKQGYAKALDDNGIRNVKRLVTIGDYSLESGRIAMEQLLNLDRKPTAVFAANDLMAFGAMDMLKKRGIKIPDDIAVAGFDDIPFASIYNPSLTTVSQPTFQMGSLAMQMLIDRLSGKSSLESREIILKPTITIRESTGINTT